MAKSLNQILRSAKRHVEEGRIELARQHYESILQKYPQNRQALAGLKTLLKADTAREQVNELISLFKQEKFKQVLELGSILRSRYPNLPLIPNLIGAANAGLGEFECAIENYRAALQIQINFPEAHYNLGSALNQLGKAEEAVLAYKKAIKLKPDFAQAYYNLGNALVQLGKHADSVACFTTAIQLNPDYVDAHHNLANVLSELGKTEEAVRYYQRCIALEPRNKQFWQNFSRLLPEMTFTLYSEQWANIFLNVLAQKTLINPTSLSIPIISMLKAHPAIREALTISQSENLETSATKIIDNLSAIPLLLRYIELSVVNDLQLEQLLKALRLYILSSVIRGEYDPNPSKLLVSLALHCYTNEYVFGSTQLESAASKMLQAQIEGLLTKNEQPAPSMIACFACYFPLHTFEWSLELQAPKELAPIFRRQIAETQIELDIRHTIPSIGFDVDETSRAVRSQYEQNPYPRWENTKLFAKSDTLKNIANKLNLKFKENTLGFTTNPQILIAGCGTGENAIGTATRIANSSVLAIDLSLSSLSYAIRKSNELDVSNIKFVHADILNLDCLNKQFDMIESSGVLHHMADPLSGWHILTSLLKPGGFMKIALYSELARSKIVAARGLIAELGISQNPEDILKFRATILSSDNTRFSELRDIANYTDFFSTSELRDLLFHVQEHRFTLPQIKDHLTELGLSFAGFEFEDSSIIRKFRLTFPNPESVYDLDAWHEFECSNVDTFYGMYQFWLQKN